MYGLQSSDMRHNGSSSSNKSGLCIMHYSARRLLLRFEIYSSMIIRHLSLRYFQQFIIREQPAKF
ncbi:15767_t:CDS:2 [Dentiscutata erythropus]|uniref:15767_t:CDS:1 n=1 Tax=Dentiscutata erythropus TaxID=1348616 RepID=A0A9N9AIT0_9GLOM|nr:15767_t:CDS:2 [Dentiscutata erythropus]